MQQQYTPNPDDQHDRNYIEFRTAIDEINGILKEMDQLLATQEQGRAARVIRELWDPKMDMTLDRAKIALAKWMVGIHSLAQY